MTLSGYTITMNCKSLGLPFIESIIGAAEFCDEVVVVDFGSTDGTFEDIANLRPDMPKLRIYESKWEWNKPDMMGIAKTEARKRCQGDFCFLFDTDEIIHENDGPKVRSLIDKYPTTTCFVLPIIHWFGGVNAINPRHSDRRLSITKNEDWIEHGVPKRIRRYRADGSMYFSRTQSDACGYIDSETQEDWHIKPIRMADYTTKEFLELKNQVKDKFNINADAYAQLKTYYEKMFRELPCVHHYSWIDIERKVAQQKNFWDRMPRYIDDELLTKSAICDKEVGDVTDEDIKKNAQGVIDEEVYLKVDFSLENHPKCMHQWLLERGIGDRP